MEAKEYLKQIERCDVGLECKEIEKTQWHDLSMRITANMEGERVQSSGSQTTMADAVEKCMDAQREIVQKCGELVVVRLDVIRTIDKVQNPTWYKLLHMVYVRYIDLKDVAVKFNKSYDWAKSAHSKALKIVQKILDEEKDTF